MMTRSTTSRKEGIFLLSLGILYLPLVLNSNNILNLKIIIAFDDRFPNLCHVIPVGNFVTFYRIKKSTALQFLIAKTSKGEVSINFLQAFNIALVHRTNFLVVVCYSVYSDVNAIVLSAPLTYSKAVKPVY